MRNAVHLVRRFAGSLRPGPPSSVDEVWARGQLLPGEVELWGSMPNPDRRHGVGVARAVVELLGEDATRPVMAAALLHDVGKTATGLHTPGRVVATVLGAVLPDERVPEWAERAGWRGVMGRYHLHPAIGADLLRAAGSDPLTADWAAQHHQPQSTWTVPCHLARALKAADDD
ncbi:MAG: HD domain-containing protein [Actinomycetia bacterium]|nr:HD domain-containing protein [Actinomycetes bacterium]